MTDPTTAVEPGERSWQRIARLRAEIKKLRRLVDQESPAAAAEARKAGVRADELATAWGVSEGWVYRIARAARGTRNQQ